MPSAMQPSAREPLVRDGVQWVAPADEAPEVCVIEPGLVHIRRALGKAEQLELAAAAEEEGEARRGFYDGGQLNSTATRGRIYDRISRFPDALPRMCLAQVARARAADPAMPAMVPTHLLLLKYTAPRGMGFHRDNGENDGAGDFPVVSLSVGNECVFAVKHARKAAETALVLQSGDAVLFGGPCRQILHAVTEVRPGTAPAWLPAPFRAARLNFTFRHAPEIIGREAGFALYRPGASPLEANRFVSTAEAEAGRARAGAAAGGESRRICPRGNAPLTRAQFDARHGAAAAELWGAAQPGPAAAAVGAEGAAEREMASRLSGAAAPPPAEKAGGERAGRRAARQKGRLQ